MQLVQKNKRYIKLKNKNKMSAFVLEFDSKNLEERDEIMSEIEKMVKDYCEEYEDDMVKYKSKEDMASISTCVVIGYPLNENINYLERNIQRQETTDKIKSIVKGKSTISPIFFEEIDPRDYILKF
ncbi:hypothetical protein [Helicobacter rodentium]|nr:hypothetical protein [Helicobacter rodentium]